MAFIYLFIHPSIHPSSSYLLVWINGFYFIHSIIIHYCHYLVMKLLQIFPVKAPLSWLLCLFVMSSSFFGHFLIFWHRQRVQGSYCTYTLPVLKLVISLRRLSLLYWRIYLETKIDQNKKVKVIQKVKYLLWYNWEINQSMNIARKLESWMIILHKLQSGNN